ncbi:MAG: hypothetical protein HN348_14425, partial [Proteobacteria bacterium]|nr:hypothetical protein [Pseudomonadota bacterium]
MLTRLCPVRGLSTQLHQPCQCSLLLDVAPPSDSQLKIPLPAAHSAFAYIYRGKGIIASQSVERGQLVVLGD